MALISSCASHRKLAAIKSGDPAASLVLGKDVYVPEIKQAKTMRDTLRIKDDDGTELLLMKAIRDEESGEMIRKYLGFDRLDNEFEWFIS